MLLLLLTEEDDSTEELLSLLLFILLLLLSLLDKLPEKFKQAATEKRQQVTKINKKNLFISFFTTNLQKKFLYPYYSIEFSICQVK